jgi:hypothetical protein
VGVIGLFVPELLESLLPPEAAGELIQITPLLLGAGLTLEKRCGMSAGFCSYLLTGAANG